MPAPISCRAIGQDAERWLERGLECGSARARSAPGTSSSRLARSARGRAPTERRSPVPRNRRGCLQARPPSGDVSRETSRSVNAELQLRRSRRAGAHRGRSLARRARRPSARTPGQRRLSVALPAHSAMRSAYGSATSRLAQHAAPTRSARARQTPARLWTLVPPALPASARAEPWSCVPTGCCRVSGRVAAAHCRASVACPMARYLRLGPCRSGARCGRSSLVLDACFT